MYAFGESINPLEEGNRVYEVDARTYYLGVGYEIGAFSLGAMYGQTKYGSDKESEINFSADYTFNDNLSFGGIIADVDAQNSTEDYTKFAIHATYTF